MSTDRLIRTLNRYDGHVGRVAESYGVAWPEFLTLIGDAADGVDPSEGFCGAVSMDDIDGWAEECRDAAKSIKAIYRAGQLSIDGAHVRYAPGIPDMTKPIPSVHKMPPMLKALVDALESAENPY